MQTQIIDMNKKKEQKLKLSEYLQCGQRACSADEVPAVSPVPVKILTEKDLKYLRRRTERIKAGGQEARKQATQNEAKQLQKKNHFDTSDCRKHSSAL